MFISKKHLTRRTILRGAGAAVALPLLDAMVPAATAIAQTPAAARTRLTCIYNAHGATMYKWTPEAEGRNFELSEILAPLEPLRDHLCVVSGLRNEPVGPMDGEDSGGAQNHGRAVAAFLTAAHPKRGHSAYVGVSLDQLAAREIGQDTPLPSVELSIEPAGVNCGADGSCAYSNTMSWRTPTLPLPMQNNPQLVFERLFGDGATEAQRQERRAKSASLLDSIREQVASLNRNLPAADQARLNEYLQEVREIERRVQLADARLSADLDLPEKPIGIPRDFETHTELMFDLQVLAYKAEITRISSLMLSRENSNVVYPNSGVSEGFHNASHHSNERANMERFALINRYHVGILRRFIEKLATTPDGDGTLLDHSLVLFGSSLSDPNEHNYDPLPILLIGGASERLVGGRHLRYPDGTPLANLHLSILDKLGIHRDSFGNSTGALEV
jgi:hypothetical protein